MCWQCLRYKDNPKQVVRELLGRRETVALLTKSKPAFFALQELTKMVASCDATLPLYVAMSLNEQLENMDRVLGR